MKISWIKYYKDENSFKVPEHLGFDVFKIQDLEESDNQIKQLIQKNYNTIIITNQIAGTSQDIIKKYDKNDDVNIIIAKRND